MTMRPDSYFAIPLTISILAITALWIYDAVWESRRARRRHALMYRCTVCGRVYEDSRNVPLSACPGCGGLNEPSRHG